LRAVAIGRSAVTRSPVLTRYPDRPAEVGVPSENPHLVERGLIITDFVDRVGDPVPLLAGDGSSHRAEVLVADALASLLSAVTGGGSAAEPVGVTHPAHWRPSAVDALRGALDGKTSLTSDAVAALTALQDDPGVPSRGIIALCDVGGSGASVTLADAANGFQPIGPTVRHADFSGDLVDQALLRRVVGDLAASDAVDLSSTSAIGNLSRLRGQCRAAKERLSTAAATSLTVELPGRRTEVRITRTELDDTIREPLDGLLDVLQDTLQRSGIRLSDLVAVASVGGTARMPILTTALSERLRVPVITSAQPELAAAIGGGLTAVRGVVPDGATSMAPVAPIVAAPDPVAPQSSTFRALAWSDADDLPEPMPADPFEPHQPEEPYETYEPYDPRPQVAFTPRDEDVEAAAAPMPWYRRPVGMVAVGAVAVLAAVGGVAYYALRDDESATPASTSSTSSTSATTTTDPQTSDVPQPSSEAPPETQAPDQTVYQQAPPPPVTETVTEPPPVTESPPPSTEAPPPPPTTTEPPPTVTVTESPPSSTTQQPIIPTLPYQTIPGLPFVPAPIQPPSP
jgi:hypothetical protein